jgi:hypothetical protein
MVTRTRDHTRRAKEYTYGTIRYDASRRAFFATRRLTVMHFMTQRGVLL